MIFKLSASLSGHSSDVRALAAQGNDALISASRDKTGRLWKRTTTHDFAEDSVFIGHTGYVNSVAVLSATAECPSGLIATGDLAQPVSKLTGHTDNVCALAASKDGKTLVSGSWDKTAKVWENGVLKHTLQGHAHAVWSVLVLDDGSVLTGSADKTIRRWVDGVSKHVYTGHTDCVRALAVLPGVGFVSSGNDSAIRTWSLDGACLSELYDHTSFVYSIDVLPDGAIVSGGEDRCVKVWRNGGVEQTILVPSTSGASEEATKEFEAANASLPGKERLGQPGTKDQQVIMSSQKWSKVGEVVDAVGQSQKQVFDGKEYDYVFDVDIQEGAPPLKLPYNVTENVYSAAQKFLERNQLNMESVPTKTKVADPFTGGSRYVPGGGSAAASQSGDPFTGGNRYIPGGSGQAAGGHSGDPFTGGNRYVPGGSSAAALSSYAPPRDYIINRTSAALTEPQIEAVRTIEAAVVSGQAVSPEAVDVVLRAVLMWPKNKRFPGLDLLRLGFVEIVGDATGIFSLLSSSQAALSKEDEINLMMGARAIGNSFAHAEGIDLNLVTALSNVYMNMAIAATQKGDDDDGLTILSPASLFLTSTNNADAQLRLINVFGILAAKFPMCKDSARILGDEMIVILGIKGQTDAVRKAARDVGAFLSA
ncbi:WD40 repeat-like protein [Linderina pennispora]|uniref:WD40 repeat-like protein n=1 Tax=Linderina pennispora TaxID=61395 RepID=A0A1Y1W4E9_9FUNG|nr:WD40 repeat-like protein [Linderina pennispora]ORX68044.1 WD40 repeat-like protein [Linderina pennispora]